MSKHGGAGGAGHSKREASQQHPSRLQLSWDTAQLYSTISYHTVPYHTMYERELCHIHTRKKIHREKVLEVVHVHEEVNQIQSSREAAAVVSSSSSSRQQTQRGCS